MRERHARQRGWQGQRQRAFESAGPQGVLCQVGLFHIRAWAGLGHKTISWHVGDRQKNESGWRQAIRSQGEKDIMQRAGKRSRREEGTANMDSSLKRFDWERNRERFF